METKRTRDTESWTREALDLSYTPDKSTTALVMALNGQTNAFLAVAEALHAVADAIRDTAANR